MGIPFLNTEAIKVKETAVMSHTLRQLCSSMDIPLVIAKKLYSGKKIPSFFLFRMWIGYGFDAAEIAAVMVNPGFVYSNTTWMYVFYFYLAFVVIIGFILTVSFKLSVEISDNKLHSCFAFFQVDLGSYGGGHLLPALSPRRPWPADYFHYGGHRRRHEPRFRGDGGRMCITWIQHGVSAGGE